MGKQHSLQSHPGKYQVLVRRLREQDKIWARVFSVASLGRERQGREQGFKTGNLNMFSEVRASLRAQLVKNLPAMQETTPV